MGKANSTKRQTPAPVLALYVTITRWRHLITTLPLDGTLAEMLNRQAQIVNSLHLLASRDETAHRDFWIEVEAQIGGEAVFLGQDKLSGDGLDELGVFATECLAKWAQA
jgi:hypothetical protein